MINLLPPAEKRLLALDRQKKIAWVFSIVILAALACLACVLLALKFYLLKDVQDAKAQADVIARSYAASPATSFNAVIPRYNAELSRLNAFYQENVPVSLFLNNFLQAAIPQGVHLTGMEVEKSADGKTASVTLEGNSDTRDELLAFKDGLEHSPALSKVSFPPESWVQPSHIIFKVNFQVANPA